MTKGNFRKLLALIVVVLTFIYVFLITFYTVPEANMDFANIILGFLIGTAVTMVLSFYFGDSEGKGN